MKNISILFSSREDLFKNSMRPLFVYKKQEILSSFLVNAMDIHSEDKLVNPSGLSETFISQIRQNALETEHKQKNPT